MVTAHGESLGVDVLQHERGEGEFSKAINELPKQIEIVPAVAQVRDKFRRASGFHPCREILAIRLCPVQDEGKIWLENGHDIFDCQGALAGSHGLEQVLNPIESGLEVLPVPFIESFRKGIPVFPQIEFAHGIVLNPSASQQRNAVATVGANRGGRGV
jgi:hypothetical protein